MSTAATPTQSGTTHFGGPGNSNAGHAGGGTRLSPATSLPFTFLITFVAIFLFFVGCGCGSRRYILEHRRIRATQRAEEEARERRMRAETQRPALWEVWPRDGGGSERWADVQPLSATYARAHPLEPLPRSPGGGSAPSSPIARPPPPTLYAELYDRFPTLRMFVRPPSPPPLSPILSLPPPLPVPTPVIGLQVAFIVAMPDANRRHRQPHSMAGAADAKARRDSENSYLQDEPPSPAVEADDIGEYAIGMLAVPWREDT